jgi:hypothetical protein
MLANRCALLLQRRHAQRPACSPAVAAPAAVRARGVARRSDGGEQCALAASHPAAVTAPELPLRVRAASTACALATASALALGFPVRRTVRLPAG